MADFSTNNYIEDDGKEALYNKKVAGFLFRYIFKYKKYLFTSLFFVVVITLISLMIPYFSKILIDRYIIKEGYSVDIKNLKTSGENEKFFLKKIKTGVRLSDTAYFLFNDKLNFFSKTDIELLKKENVFSRDKLYLIEKPALKSNAVNEKLIALVLTGDALKFESEFFVLSKKAVESFTFNETIDLRHFDFTIILLFGIFLVLILLFQFISSYLQVINLSKLSNNAMKDLRCDLLRKITSYELSFFDKTPVGVLVNRLTNDVEALKEMFSDVVVALLQDIILIVGITIIIFRENLFLAGIFALTFPFVAVVIIFFRIKSKQSYLKVRDKISSMNAFLNESIMGVRIIRIFTSEKKTLNKFAKRNNELHGAYMNQIFVYAVFRPLIQLIKWLSFGALIYFGANGILSHKISYGMLVLFLQYVETFFRPLDDIAEKFDIIISANSAGEKILTVYNDKSRIEKDKRDTTFDHAFNGKIEFKNVSFAYKEDEPVLKDISFTAAPGETVAIVGETGSGKSTIISLLSRFYEIETGNILIDGKDLKNISYRSLRKNIASVMQDITLFSKSIRDNIILNNDFDRAKFQSVLEQTHLLRFIDGQPEKEETVVAERGVTFSAGERQLLSFARALYSDPAVLVLDEATSFIDSETEKLIQDATAKLVKNRTSIIIAHRLSTIKNSDKILVVEEGRIVESGTHRELLSKKGIYFNLYSLQFADIGK